MGTVQESLSEKRGRRRSVVAAACMAAAALLAGTAPAAEQNAPRQPAMASLLSAPQQLYWQPNVAHANAVLTVSGPGEVHHRYEFPAGSAFALAPFGADGTPLPDGQYSYEIVMSPAVDGQTRAYMNAMRESPDRGAVVADLRRAGKLPRDRQVVSGYFRILGGAFVTEDAAGAEPPPRSRRTPR